MRKHVRARSRRRTPPCAPAATGAPEALEEKPASWATADAAARAAAQLNEELLTCPRASRCTPSSRRSWSAAKTSTRAASTGATPSRSRSASLLRDGVPIRLTGQDSERGTFAHRHAVLHDVATGETFTPAGAPPDAMASFEIHNSPLSENACLGFEYGYSVTQPDALVIWEAQFGDFATARR